MSVVVVANGECSAVVISAVVVVVVRSCLSSSGWVCECLIWPWVMIMVDSWLFTIRYKSSQLYINALRQTWDHPSLSWDLSHYYPTRPLNLKYSHKKTYYTLRNLLKYLRWELRNLKVRPTLTSNNLDLSRVKDRASRGQSRFRKKHISRYSTCVVLLKFIKQDCYYLQMFFSHILLFK